MSTAAKQPKDGKIIRVSDVLYHTLDSRKPESVSWDAFLRKAFNIPARKRKGLVVKYLWVLESTKQIFESLAEARGAAVVNAAAKGSRETEKPLRFKESS